jgi:hypothetical protein
VNWRSAFCRLDDDNHFPTITNSGRPIDDWDRYMDWAPVKTLMADRFAW